MVGFEYVSNEYHPEGLWRAVNNIGPITHWYTSQDYVGRVILKAKLEGVDLETTREYVDF